MENREIRYQFGSLDNITPETFGEPGNRTFRLSLFVEGYTGLVWLEKEQLFELSKYFEDLCGDNPDRKDNTGFRECLLASDYQLTEFKCRQLSVNFDKDSDTFYVECREEGETIDDTSSLSFYLSGSQAVQLAKAGIEICESGRPICPLCHNPIDPDSHFCPKSNGHSKL